MIDIKIPRQAMYSSFKEKPGACPRCGGELVNEHQTYAVATRRGKRVTDSFIIGSDFGWFCKSCPTVVINSDELREMLSVGKNKWNIGLEYAALGIVNLDAIPANKRHLPIGDEDNPMPLVEFREISESESGTQTPTPSERESADKVESPVPTRRLRHRRRR